LFAGWPEQDPYAIARDMLNRLLFRNPVFIALFLYAGFFSPVVAQDVTTLNNYIGNWSDNTSWVGGTQPNPLYTDIGGQNITIEGYINVGEYGITQDLTFAVNNSAFDLVIEDTLVIYGDLEFKLDAMNLIVNGFLIVFGDVIFRNRVDVVTNGEIIVDGTLSFLGAQGTYDGDGNVYANNINDTGGGGGKIPGNQEKDIANDLQNDYPDIYDFVINGGQSVLPVEVLYFTASRLNDTVLLRWATVREENFDFFTVERSSDGEKFHELGILSSRSDFSDTKEDYEFYDELPLPRYSFYRLKATDLDGHVAYHGIVSVRMDGQGQRFRIYPNPSRGDQVSLLYSGILDNRYRLVSFAGQVIQTGTISPGNNAIHFIQPLPPGLYFIQVGEGLTAGTSKLIVR